MGGTTIGTSIGSDDSAAVAQVADDVVCGPLGTAGRGDAVVGSEALQDRHEPPPLLPKHPEEVLWIEVTRPTGAQQQPALSHRH
jgi:hypothetical protein